MIKTIIPQTSKPTTYIPSTRYRISVDNIFTLKNNRYKRVIGNKKQSFVLELMFNIDLSLFEQTMERSKLKYSKDKYTRTYTHKYNKRVLNL